MQVGGGGGGGGSNGIDDPCVFDHGERRESTLSAGDTGAVPQFSSREAALKSRAFVPIPFRPVDASMKLASEKINTQHNSTVVGQQRFDGPLLLYVADVAVAWGKSTDSTVVVLVSWHKS